MTFMTPVSLTRKTAGFSTEARHTDTGTFHHWASTLSGLLQIDTSLPAKFGPAFCKPTEQWKKGPWSMRWDEILSIGDYFINHEIRIPVIKQPTIQWKVRDPVFFWSWLNCAVRSCEDMANYKAMHCYIKLGNTVWITLIFHIVKWWLIEWWSTTLRITGPSHLEPV